MGIFLEMRVPLGNKIVGKYGRKILGNVWEIRVAYFLRYACIMGDGFFGDIRSLWGMENEAWGKEISGKCVLRNSYSMGLETLENMFIMGDGNLWKCVYFCGWKNFEIRR